MRPLIFALLFICTPLLSNAQSLTKGIVTTAVGSSFLAGGLVTVGVGINNGYNTGRGKSQIIAGSAISFIGIAGAIVGIHTIVTVAKCNKSVAKIAPSTESIGVMFTYQF